MIDMLAASLTYLQAAEYVDAALLVCGGLCGVAFVVWLLQRGRWRNPLAGVKGSGEGPSVVDLAIVVFLYLVVGWLLMPGAGVRGAAATTSQSVANALEPGSFAWHIATAADSVARILCAAVMVGMLRRRRSFRSPPSGHRGLLWTLALGLLGGLIVTPVCTLQLRTATIIWQWLNPGAALPVHPVLLALRNSAWGVWGGVQLLVVAVVVAPVAEELFFRGLVLQTVWRYTRHGWMSVLVSGLVFGGIHSQPQDILPLCTLGVMQGYIRLRTGSLAVCIVVHALFNGRTMVMALFFPELLNEG
jgi:membrane protease YdiL (CAAX protease family)